MTKNLVAATNDQPIKEYRRSGGKSPCVLQRNCS